MAGAYILYNDVLSAANAVPLLSHTSTGTSTEVPTLPLPNLLDRRVAKIARITRANANQNATTVLTFPLASYSGEKSVRAIAIVGFRLTADSGADLTSSLRFKVEVFSGPSTVVYASGGFGIVGSIVPKGVALVALHVFPTVLTANEKIVLSVTRFAALSGNTESLDIGRVFVSDGLEFPEGVDADWNLVMADSARVLRSSGQQIYAQPLPRYRVGRFKLPPVPEVIAIGSMQQPNSASLQTMGLQVGTTGEVLIAPRTSDAIALSRLSIYGRFSRPVELRHLGGGNYGCDLEVEEGL